MVVVPDLKRLVILIAILLPICLSACGADGMKTEKIVKYQFVIFKANDEFYEADNGFIEVYSANGETAYPEMNNGEFALVTADVTRYEGGEVGYVGNKFIDKLISYKLISSDDAAQRCDIPEVGKESFSDKHHMLIYHSGEDIYCVFFCKGNYLVYLNNAFIGEYEALDEKEELAAFLDELSK